MPRALTERSTFHNVRPFREIAAVRPAEPIAKPAPIPESELVLIRRIPD
jgi:hypothetical protein